MITHTDQVSNFNSALFTELCKLWGISKTRTIELHPESDGMVKRFNQTILNHLSLFVSRNQTDWEKDLPLSLLAYKERGTGSDRIDSSKNAFTLNAAIAL
ncbi:hypothetical protein AVEN_139741-1 [Araneus ventricosus]|uniref:Integrase catalytic domain-containing protein n=1 Tax=Araneus ventricosus TaxID=182803 RepID=A0A4Y2NI09_ARAVE|nr:hypothetical protein AVEN_139741-1 [Araneus ventricosus]